MIKNTPKARLQVHGCAMLLACEKLHHTSRCKCGNVVYLEYIMQLINMIYNDLLLNKIRRFVESINPSVNSSIHPSINQIYLYVDHLVTSRNLTTKITWSLGKSSPLLLLFLRDVCFQFHSLSRKIFPDVFCVRWR